MLRKLIPSPSSAVALLALFVALGGTGYAAVTITGKNIKDGTVTGRDIKPRSLHGSRLKPDSIGGDAIKESTLGPVQAVAHSAVVTGAGVLARGRGVTAVARVAAGRYHVTFDRDVRGCVYVASVGDVSAAGPGTGTASVGAHPANVNTVQVRTVTYNGAGNPVNENRPFHLIVNC